MTMSVFCLVIASFYFGTTCGFQGTPFVYEVKSSNVGRGSSLMGHMFGLSRSSMSQLTKVEVNALKFKNLPSQMPSLDELEEFKMKFGCDKNEFEASKIKELAMKRYKVNDIVDGTIIMVSRKAMLIDLGLKVRHTLFVTCIGIFPLPVFFVLFLYP
jgi:hypothetical protein